MEVGWKICLPAAANKSARVKGADRNIEDSSIGDSSNGDSDTGRSEVRLLTSKQQALSSPAALEGNAKLMNALIAERQGESGVYPLSIDYLRQQHYPGSPLEIVQKLAGGSTYAEYLVSYKSEELTIYGTLSVPAGKMPASGWPVVLFVHGYIEPAIYQGTERYEAFVDAIASAGYIVFRPDLRGHGDSEGVAYGAYGDPGYTIDVLNAVASIKTFAEADGERIGIFGHSMGGYITARAMVVSHNIKAGVIWSGVVASYEELVADWGSADSTIAEGELPVARVLLNREGTPQTNPDFWASLSATSYLQDLSGPLQLHHGSDDSDVPMRFSDQFYRDLITAGQGAEYYVYAGDDHNLSASFEVAMRRSLAFLDAHVKQTGALAEAVR